MMLKDWHTYFLGSFSRSSLQNLSSSIRLDEEKVSAQAFSDLSRDHQLGSIWGLAGPLKDIHIVVPFAPTPLLSWLSD